MKTINATVEYRLVQGLGRSWHWVLKTTDATAYYLNNMTLTLADTGNADTFRDALGVVDELNRTRFNLGLPMIEVANRKRGI